jgi:Flp pilus assembly protein TadD
MVYLRSKDFDQAEQAYRAAIPILEKASSRESAILSQWLNEYAVILRHQRRFSEAERAEVQAMRIKVRTAIEASSGTPSSASKPSS